MFVYYVIEVILTATKKPSKSQLDSKKYFGHVNKILSTQLPTGVQNIES